jgi:SAM-dependent methyltransferase
MLARLLRIITDPARTLRVIQRRLSLLEISKVNKDGKEYFRYKGELYPANLWGGNAASQIWPKVKQYCVGTGIDVGADRWPVEGAIPVRNEPLQNAYKLDSFADNSLDYVFSSHCLEHLDRPEEALALWIEKLKVGGKIVLYLPHIDMKLWLPGSPWVSDPITGHKWSPTYTFLADFFAKHNVKVIDGNPGRDYFWSFHIVGEKTA